MPSASTSGTPRPRIGAHRNFVPAAPSYTPPHISASKSSSTSSPRLPFDILELIISALCADAITLSTLSVTCRALLLPSRRCLFSSISLAYGIDQSQISVYYALATLLRTNPVLSGFVKEVKVVNAVLAPGSPTPAGWPGATSAALSGATDNPVAVAVAELSVLSVEAHTPWFTCLRSTLPIILSSALNLEVLHVSGRNQNWNTLPPPVQNIFHITFGLPSIKELSIAWTQAIPEHTFRQCSGIYMLGFKLVSIETANGDGTGVGPGAATSPAQKLLQQVSQRQTSPQSRLRNPFSHHQQQSSLPGPIRRKYPGGTQYIRLQPISKQFYLTLANNLDLRNLQRCSILDPTPPISVASEFLVSMSPTWRTLQTVSMDLASCAVNANQVNDFPLGQFRSLRSLTITLDAQSRPTLQLILNSLRSLTPQSRTLFCRLNLNVYWNFFKDAAATTGSVVGAMAIVGRGRGMSGSGRAERYPIPDPEWLAIDALLSNANSNGSSSTSQHPGNNGAFMRTAPSDKHGDWNNVGGAALGFPSDLNLVFNYFSPHPIPPHSAVSDGEYIKSRTAILFPRLVRESKVYFTFRGWKVLV